MDLCSGFFTRCGEQIRPFPQRLGEGVIQIYAFDVGSYEHEFSVFFWN